MTMRYSVGTIARCSWRCQYQYFLIVTNQKHRYLLAFLNLMWEENWTATTTTSTKGWIVRWSSTKGVSNLMKRLRFIVQTNQQCRLNAHTIGNLERIFVENNADNLHWIETIPYLTQSITNAVVCECLSYVECHSNHQISYQDRIVMHFRWTIFDHIVCADRSLIRHYVIREKPIATVLSLLYVNEITIAINLIVMEN